jgi:hypothetical protein
MTTQRIDYNFNASALAVGGYFIRDGRKTVVPSLASVALSPDGGEGWTSLVNYDQDGIAFTRAESRVSGYETSPNFFTTRSDIYLTNLSVFGKVNIGLLQATVTSTRDLEDRDSEEAKFQLHASFYGIDVDGAGIIPSIDVDVCEASYRELADRTIREIEEEPVRERDAKDRAIAAIKRGEPIRSTMLKEMTHGNRPGFAKEGKHVLKVPGFAKIHFGELLVKQGRRRVNLLRFDFDEMLGNEFEDSTVPRALAARGGVLQPASGSITVASGDGNGEPVWPRG